ncbi:MAG: divalent cation tolerance protein CutA [Alphaproteobacteria bacterium]|nr:divalent cation tolerance protein CutA [Alphaproteobacteria bacterium]
MTGILFTYITCKDAAEAEKIAAALVGEKLAACVNILPPITSIYEWQGKVEKGAEVAMVAKTRAGLFEKVAARVRALHSYETPCIVALPVAAGDAAFLDWVRRATS